MEVKIQISDAVYTQLLQGNKRIAGSLVLDNPLQGNFRAYNKSHRRKTVKQSIKLPHGRVSMNETDVSMYLKNSAHRTSLASPHHRGREPHGKLLYRLNQ